MTDRLGYPEPTFKSLGALESTKGRISIAGAERSPTSFIAQSSNVVDYTAHRPSALQAFDRLDQAILLPI